MRKEKYGSSFEKKIKKSFSNYGNITFIVILSMMLLFITYEQFVQFFIASSVSKNNIEEYIDTIETKLTGFMDELVTVKSNAEFYSKFYSFTNQENIPGNVIIYDENSDVRYITQPALEGSIYNRTFNKTFLNHINLDENIVLTSMRQDSMNSSSNTLMFGKKIKDENNKTLSIIFYLDSRLLKDVLQHQSVNHLLITDSHDYVVASTSQSFIGPLNRFQANNISYIDSDIDYRTSSKPIHNTDLIIHSLILKKPFWEYYGLVTVFLFLFFLTYRRMNKKVAERIGNEAAASINKLVLAVNDIKEGNLLTTVEIDTEDEFQMLGEEFNQMSQQLHFLIERNNQLLELRKNAEIKQLQAQFNPHFLYNSLETIRYLIASDKERAQSLILSTTKLLRYSIDGDKNLVRFRDDLEYLKLYLQINKVRLDERFNYTIQVNPDVLDFMMPKLMIQPLIENSIKHGYKNQDTLNITLTGRSNKESIFIAVEDNGSGMSKETLNEIQELSKSKAIESKNYGLHSIIQRLHLIYGDKSELKIESSALGTTVLIKLPKRTLDDLLKKEKSVN